MARLRKKQRKLAGSEALSMSQRTYKNCKRFGPANETAMFDYRMIKGGQHFILPTTERLRKKPIWPFSCLSASRMHMINDWKEVVAVW